MVTPALSAAPPAATAPPPAGGAPKGRNVLLITVDSLRADMPWAGYPRPIAPRLTEHFGGAKIYLKREDLNHTGAHKINNTIGQALLTLRMGKKRLIHRSEIQRWLGDLPKA